MKKLLHLILYLSLLMVSLQQDIRETDDNLLWINVPVNVKDINKFLTPGLIPSIYQDKAWISILLFNIVSIESQIFGRWINLPLSKGLTTKVSLLVETQNGEKGYLLLSLDVESGFAGAIKSFGCSQTQLGVICETTKKIDLNPSKFTWITDQDYYVKGSYNIKSESFENKEFSKFIIDRPFKFESEKGKTYFSPQEDKENPKNFEVNTIEFTNISSNILNKRFGIPNFYENDLCKNNICFWGNYLQFQDHAVKEYKK